MSIKNAVLATLAALTIAGYSAAGLADDAPAYGRAAAPAPLEGTWVVTIRPIFCTTTPAGKCR